MPLMAIPVGYYVLAGGSAALLTWYYGLGGKEATMQAGEALANSMANADEQAGSTLNEDAAVDATTTCGDCVPPECRDLNDKIRERRNELSQRYQEMREDARGLFRNHYETWQAHPVYGSWMGHIQQYNDKQRGLRKLLDRARTLGCPTSADDVNTWSSRDSPTQPGP